MKKRDLDMVDDLELSDQELESAAQAARDRKVWIFVGIVSLVIVGVLLGVIDHAMKKPTSPQALVAAAFNMPSLTVQEWKPGMGPKPLLYHPAAFQTPNKSWTPMYSCPTHGANGAPTFDANGMPHCPTCNQLMVNTR